jgi:hypothetical protein
LSDPVAGGVAYQRTHGALEVQSAVFVEAMILDGDLRLPHDRSDFVQLHRNPVLVIKERENLAVAHEYLAPGGRCRRCKLSRQTLQFCGRGVAGNPCHARERNEQSCHQNTGENADDDKHHQRVREAPRALRRKRHEPQPTGAVGPHRVTY